MWGSENPTTPPSERHIRVLPGALRSRCMGDLEMSVAPIKQRIVSFVCFPTAGNLPNILRTEGRKRPFARHFQSLGRASLGIRGCGMSRHWSGPSGKHKVGGVPPHWICLVAYINKSVTMADVFSEAGYLVRAGPCLEGPGCAADGQTELIGRFHECHAHGIQLFGFGVLHFESLTL
jgi:hypothetical protein